MMTKKVLGVELSDFWKDIACDQRVISGLFNSVPAGVVIVNEAGTILFFSREAERMFGYTSEEIVGRMVEILLPERFRGDHPALRAQFNKKPAYREMGHERNLWACRKDGSEFPIEVGLGYSNEGGNMYISAVIIDITKRKVIEQEREVLITELKSALEQVKQLRGFLAICAKCKKIRDDNGRWNQFEVYIRDHSEAEFTHGICPECMHELYPELDNED